MDSIFAIQGKDYVLVVCDSTAAYSILKFKVDNDIHLSLLIYIFFIQETEDKIIALDDNKLMGMSGEAADRLQFGDFMQKNIHLKKYKTGIKLTTKETANFIRFDFLSILKL